MSNKSVGGNSRSSSRSSSRNASKYELAALASAGSTSPPQEFGGRLPGGEKQPLMLADEDALSETELDAPLAPPPLPSPLAPSAATPLADPSPVELGIAAAVQRGAVRLAHASTMTNSDSCHDWTGGAS